MDNAGVINISDDTSSDSDGMDTDSNSSPDSLLDNDDVIFVNHTNCQTGRKNAVFSSSSFDVGANEALKVCEGWVADVPSASSSQPG